MGKRNRIVASVVFVLALVGVASAVAVAAIPSSTGEITACYKNNGILRVIDVEAGDSCSNGETQLVWNTEGPTGPPGPPALQVVDGTGAVVGPLLSDSGGYLVVQRSDGTVVRYSTGTGDVTGSIVVAALFTTTDCTGTAYVGSSSTGDGTFILGFSDVYNAAVVLPNEPISGLSFPNFDHTMVTPVLSTVDPNSIVADFNWETNTCTAVSLGGTAPIAELVPLANQPVDEIGPFRVVLSP